MMLATVWTAPGEGDTLMDLSDYLISCGNRGLDVADAHRRLDTLAAGDQWYKRANLSVARPVALTEYDVRRIAHAEAR